MTLHFFSPARRLPDDDRRQASLDALGILDTPPDPELDRIVAEAAARFDMPMAALSLVDNDRQWFKAKFGVDATETPRAYSFCAHVLGEREGVMVVPDASADARFRGNPLVTGDLHLRFYAGAVVTAPDGQPLGALCVIGDRPHRDLRPAERDVLKAFAQAATTILARRA